MVMTFKRTIQRLLMRKVVVPIFVIFLIMTILLFGLWNVMAIESNRNNIHRVSREFESSLKIYTQFFISLDEIIFDIQNLTARSQQITRIYEKFYEAQNQTQLRSNLYIFDSNGIMMLPANRAARRNNFEFVYNWGISRRIKQVPDQIHFHHHYENGEKFLLIGTGVYDANQEKGFAVISISNTKFFEYFSNLPTSIILTNNRGRIIFGEYIGVRDERNRLNEVFRNQNGFVNYDAYDFDVRYRSLIEGELIIYSFSSRALLRNLLFYTMIFLLGILVVMTIFLHKVASIISITSASDIEELNIAFIKVQEGNFEAKLSFTSTTELVAITESFNTILEKLSQYVERNKEISEYYALSQMKQLQSQFNPHFLFNTLETIRVMCKFDEKIASRMILELSTILRYSISGMNADVPFEQDLEYVKSYLNLMKMRYDERLTYQINVSSEVLESRVPKLLIQPLIENSLQHGFGDKDSLNISIVGKIVDSNLVIECSDNGAGIELEELNKLNDSLHKMDHGSEQLGLYQVHRRVFLKCGNNHGLAIRSKRGEGTQMLITLPVEN